MRRISPTPAFPLLALLGLLALGPARAESGDAVADRVLGQSRFDTFMANRVDARGLLFPKDVAIDRSVEPNRVWVADTGGSRVLGWRDLSRLVGGSAADVVIGFPDPFVHWRPATEPPSAASLFAPEGVAVDADGNLWVADTGADRVLGYDSPFEHDAVADRVLGQGGSFTGAVRCGDAAAGHLCRPGGLAVDADGALWVADTGHCRVLLYESPLAGGAPDLPEVFLGFAGSGGGEVCAAECRDRERLCLPQWLAVGASGDLLVSEPLRVREWRSPRATDLVPDRLVIERTAGCLGGPSRPDAVCVAAGVAVDEAGSVWVADAFSNRVLRFDDEDGTADAVLGQSGFAAGACNRGGRGDAASLCLPAGLALDGAGGLWVADQQNHRALRFGAPRERPAADLALGQRRFDVNAPNGLDGAGLDGPLAVAVDRSVTPPRLWVADTRNHRVLGFRDAAGFANGARADVVLGQPDLVSNGCNNGGRSAASLCSPRGLAVDGRGTVWVADHLNQRVLAFHDPFAGDRIADLVLGQRSYGSAVCAIGADGLCGPLDVAVDARGVVAVADHLRVLLFRDPLTTDRLADRVLGQRGFRQRRECHRQGVSAATLCGPTGVALSAAGDLFVADQEGHRVLGFRAPMTSDAIADAVLGQAGSFVQRECNGGDAPVDAGELCGPSDVALDAQGRLWVADTGNHRVLRFDRPWEPAAASLVLGQRGDFMASEANRGGIVDAESLAAPWGVAVGPDGDLFVADLLNNRVLAYEIP